MPLTETLRAFLVSARPGHGRSDVEGGQAGKPQEAEEQQGQPEEPQEQEARRVEATPVYKELLKRWRSIAGLEDGS